MVCCFVQFLQTRIVIPSPAIMQWGGVVYGGAYNLCQQDAALVKPTASTKRRVWAKGSYRSWGSRMTAGISLSPK